jgi:hypothetical protein
MRADPARIGRRLSLAEAPQLQKSRAPQSLTASGRDRTSLARCHHERANTTSSQPFRALHQSLPSSSLCGAGRPHLEVPCPKYQTKGSPSAKARPDKQTNINTSTIIEVTCSKHDVGLSWVLAVLAVTSLLFSAIRSLLALRV